MSLSDSYRANLRRGALFLERNRFEEALPFFQRALADDPMDGHVLSQLALCQVHLKTEKERTMALRTINTAIGSEPEEAAHYGLKALILCRLQRPKEALEASQAGIALAPDEPFVRSAEAQAFLMLEQWENAERSARQALALDPDHDMASNHLVQALYEQREGEETHERVLNILANQPEDAHAHYNAGYSFLQSDEPEKSVEHFTECLRLDPTFAAARIGILEAMRAEYPIYRWYLKLHFAVDARAKKLKSRELLLPFAMPVLLFAALLHAVATFCLLFNRQARLTMDFNDKVNGLLGGGGILLGLALMSLGLVTTLWILFKIGLVIALATIAVAFELADSIPERLKM